MTTAAVEHPAMSARYARAPLNASLFAARLTREEKAAMAKTVPTPYAAKYPTAWNRLGKASAGSTPRKCELPARPCNVPTAKAAWVCE